MTEELDSLTGLPKESLPDFLTRIGKPTNPYSAINAERNKVWGPSTSEKELQSYDEPYKLTKGVNMEERRALNQGDVWALGNSLFRSVTDVAGDLIASPGYLFDYNQWMRAFKSSEDPISNTLIDFGQSIKDFGDEQFASYASDASGAFGQSAKSGFKPWDSEWWALNLPSIFSTLSLMAPSMLAGWGATKLVSKGLQIAGKTHAITSRHIENLMEGKEAYENIYAQAIQSGKSEQEAAILAGQGASNVYRANSALLLIDLFQYGKIFGSGLKYASRADDVLKTSFMKELGTQVVSEGAEEGFQFINQKAAEFVAQRRAETGDFNEGDFVDFLIPAAGEAVTDPQFYSSVFLGGFGGALFHAVGTKLGASTRALKAAALQDRLKYDALKSGDLSAYQEATNNQFIDLLSSSGSIGNMGQVINDLEAIKEDKTALANLPEVTYENGKEITRDELIDRRVQQAKRAEKIFDTVYDKYNAHGQHVVEALFKNAMKEELILDEIADRRENVFHLLADNALTKGLSDHGKVRQEAKSRIDGINKWINEIKSRDNSINTDYLNKDIADAQKAFDESIKVQTEEIAAETDPEKKKFLQSQLERDNSIVETRTDPEIGRNKARISELEEQLKTLKKDTKTIKEDPERERREAEKKLDEGLTEQYLKATEEEEKALEAKFKDKKELFKKAKEIKTGKLAKDKAEKKFKAKLDHISKFITDSKIPETFKSKLPKTEEAFNKLIQEYKAAIAKGEDPKGHRAAIVKAVEDYDSGRTEGTEETYDTIGDGGGVTNTPIFEERSDNDFTLISHQFRQDPEIAKPSPRIGPHPSAHLYDWFELNSPDKVLPGTPVEFVVRLESLNDPNDPDYKYHQKINSDTGTFIDKFQILVQATVDGKKVIVGSLRAASSANPKLRELRTKIYNEYSKNVNRNLKTGYVQSNIFTKIKTKHTGAIGNVPSDKAAPVHTLPIFGDDFLLGISRTHSSTGRKSVDTPNTSKGIPESLSRTESQSRMGTPGAVFAWIKNAAGLWHPVQLITKRLKDLGEYGTKVINDNIDTIIASIGSGAPLKESQKEVNKTVHLNFFFKKNPDDVSYDYSALAVQLPGQPVQWISTADKEELRKKLTDIMLEQIHQVDFKSLNRGTYNLSLSKNGILVTDLDPAYPIHSASVEVYPAYTVGQGLDQESKDKIARYRIQFLKNNNGAPTSETDEEILRKLNSPKPAVSNVESKKAEIKRRRQEVEKTREINELFDATKEISEDSQEVKNKIKKVNELDNKIKELDKLSEQEKNEDRKIELNIESQRLVKEWHGLAISIIQSREQLRNSLPIKQTAIEAKSKGQRLLNKLKLDAKSNEWNNSMPISKEDFNNLNDAVKRLGVRQTEVTSNEELASDIEIVDEINAKYDAELKALEQQPKSNQFEQDKIADIERRRQEELDKINKRIEKTNKREDRRVKVEIYRTLDINDNPIEVEIVTNADGTRLLRARLVNEDGSIDPMAYAVERINNKAQAILTNEQLVEAYIGNEYNTLQRTNIDENPDQTYIDKINAKYDAELAALKQPKQETLEPTPAEVDNVIDSMEDGTEEGTPTSEENVGDVQEESIEEQLEKIKDEDKKEETKPTEKVIPKFKKLGGTDSGNPLKGGKSSTVAGTEPIDPASAKKWLEDRFGDRFGGFTDKLVSSNGVASYGLLRDGLIYLAKNAPRGTEYHEAFHLVFDYFLTPAQKRSIYAESAKLDGKPTKKELKEIERVYGKVSAQEAFTLAIEERLAEQFREYVVREEKVTGIGPQIKRLFKRLLDFIKSLISNKASIDELFFRIAFTRAYKSPITSMKHWRKYANAILKPNNKAYSIPGVHPFIQDDIKRALQFSFFKAVEMEKTANDAFTNLSDVQIIAKPGMIKKLYTQVYDWAIADYEETVGQYETASGEEKTRLSTKIDVLAAVLTNFMKERDGKAEMGDLANWLKRDLRNYGINIKYKDNRPIIVEGETPEESEVIDETDTQFNSWEVDYISTSGKDTISYDVKKSLQFISIEKNNALGWPSFLDFDYIYPYLEFHLADLNDSYEMMEVLRQLSLEKIEAKSVYEALVADSDLKAKYFVNFAKTHANFYTVTESVWKKPLSQAEQDQEAEGYPVSREKRNYVKVFNSNRRGIQNLIMDDWQYNISSGDSKISTAGAVDYTKADIQLKKLQEVERQVNKLINSNEAITTKLVEEIAQIMTDSGLKATAEEVRPVVIDDTKRKEVYTEWKEWVFGGKSFKTVLGLMATKRFPGKPGVEGMSPFTGGGESGHVGNVANKIAGRRFNLTQASFRNHDNKTVYSYILPNFISKFFAQIHSDKASDFLKLYTNDPWFKDNIWLNQLMSDGKFNKDLASNFQTGIFESVRAEGDKKGTGYSTLTDAQFESTRINLFNNPEGNKPSKNFAWYMFPIPSDGTNMPIIKFQKYTQKEILEFLVRVKKQEDDRIARVRQEQETLPASKLIKNYHYVGKPNAEGMKNANGLKYQYLPLFNEPQGNTEIALTDYLEGKFKLDKDSYLNKLISLGIISKTSKDGKDIYVETGRAEGESLLDYNFASEGLEQSLRSFFYNQYLANIQMSQVFSVDLAYYKNLEDFHKRNKQSVSPAMKMDVTATYTNKNSEKFTVRPAYRALFVKDIEFKSKHYKDIKDLFIANGYSENQAKTWSAIYEDVNETDAQTYITLDRYREIMIGFGRWNDYSEAGYNRLSQGQGTQYDKDYVMNQMVVLQPIKPFSYSHRISNVPNLIHPNQNKNAEFVLIPQMVNAKNADGSFAIPKLKALYDKMINSKVDSVLFTSAVKVGEYGTADLEAWVGGADALIHSLPNNDYGIQQATPEHHLDTDANEGTQIRKLVISDLPDDIVINVPWQKESMTKQEVVDIYQKIHEFALKTAFDEVAEDFNNINTIHKKAVDQIRDLNRGEEAEDALELEEVEVARDGKMVKEIRFKMPLWLKNGYSNEATLNAIIRKAVTKQDIQGGVFINVSTYGFSDRLNIKFSEDKKSVKYIECVLPFWSKKHFSHIIDKDGNIDHSKLEKESPELLRLIGYRIPTEGKYSMYNLKVVGFSPYEAGGHIILPSEATKITGLDFDVDKLFVMAPAFEASSEDISKETEPKFKKWASTEQYSPKLGTNIVRTDIPDYDEERAKHEYAAAHGVYYDKGKWGSKEKLIKIDYDYSKDAEQNEKELIAVYGEKRGKRLARAGRNNAKLDIMRAILETPQASVQFLKGGGFDNLKAAAEHIKSLKGISKQQLDPSLPQTQSEFFRRNMAGVALKGIFVNMNNNHSITQYSPLEAKFELEFDGRKTNLISSPYTAPSTDAIANLGDKPLYTQYSTAISEVLASLVAAAVDNAKDPVLGFMNINTFTADSLGLILRMGFPIRTAVAFLNQPSIVKVTTEFFSSGGMRKEVPNIINNLKSQIYSMMSAAGVNSQAITQSQMDKANSTVYLEEAIAMYAQGKVDSIDYFITQLLVLDKFSELYEAAQVQGTINQSMTSDTKGAGPTMAANEVAIRKMDKVQDAEYPIQGAANFLSGDTYRMVRAHANYGVRKANNLLGKYFPWSQFALDDVKSYITNHIKNDDLTEDEIVYINYQIAAYYLSGHPFFDSSKRSDILGSLPARIQKFKDIHKDDSLNPAWQFTSNLRVIEKVEEETGVKRTRIEFINIGSAKGNQTDKFIKSWEDMLYTDFPRLKDEPDTKEGNEKYRLRNKAIHKLAHDLVAYSFFSNGLETSPFSFYHLIPNAFWKNTEVDGVSILSHLRELDRLQDTQEFADRLREDFLLQMVKNRQTLRETNMIPYANTKEGTGNSKLDGSGIYVPIAKFPNGVYRGETKGGFHLFAPFIQYQKEVYYKQSFDKNGARYVKLDMVGDPGYSLVYDYNTHVQGDSTKMELYVDTQTSPDEESGVMSGDEFQQALDEAKGEVGTQSGFQGYKGGFENTGKGTPQGDGKDKAMRQIADGFIGERFKQPSSTHTSYLEISNKTGKYNELSQIGNTNTIWVNRAAKVVMLARNAEFKGKPLDVQSKDAIQNLNRKGAEFVVGDMPNVDSQFIDYLQEIGAKFTIYHTGNTPRINVEGSSTTGPKGIDDVSDSEATDRAEQCK